MARVKNGAVDIDRAGNTSTGIVWGMHGLPDGGVLIGATKGLVPRTRAERHRHYRTRYQHWQCPAGVDFPGGVLIGSMNGWFLARTENGAFNVNRAGEADPGPVS